MLMSAWGAVLSIFLSLYFLAWPTQAAIGQVPGKPTVVLVDKKNNLLKLANYIDGSYKIFKEYHTTVGKVRGDKQEEDDLKTPEGIYRFTSRLLPPAIKPKFGSMAFYMNYPNSWDKLAGRTGYDIMLHATDEPDRLNNDFDSLGCIVVKNEEIEEIQHQIKVGLTRILVFSDLQEKYLHPGTDVELKKFFEAWVEDWSTKDLDGYINAYHSAFESQGKNRDQWRSFKGALNRRYHRIEVIPEDVQYYTHPKYSVVVFKQVYRSYNSAGQRLMNAQGTKTLTIGKESGKPKIIDEAYSRLLW